MKAGDKRAAGEDLATSPSVPDRLYLVIPTHIESGEMLHEHVKHASPERDGALNVARHLAQANGRKFLVMRCELVARIKPGEPVTEEYGT